MSIQGEGAASIASRVLGGASMLGGSARGASALLGGAAKGLLGLEAIDQDSGPSLMD